MVTGCIQGARDFHWNKLDLVLMHIEFSLQPSVRFKPDFHLRQNATDFSYKLDLSAENIITFNFIFHWVHFEWRTRFSIDWYFSKITSAWRFKQYLPLTNHYHFCRRWTNMHGTSARKQTWIWSDLLWIVWQCAAGIKMRVFK